MNSVAYIRVSTNKEEQELILKILSENPDKMLVLKTCKKMLENKVHIDLAVKYFSDILSLNPWLCDKTECSVIIDAILKLIVVTELDINSAMRIRNTLEILYALGNKAYVPYIINLYKMVEVDIDPYNVDAIRAKLALLAYGANAYNSSETVNLMYDIYEYIKKTKQKHLKGLVYFYHGIFYERTSFKKMLIPVKKGCSYNSNKEGCMQSAYVYGFPLASYFVE